jgi:hypothetical protein
MKLSLVLLGLVAASPLAAQTRVTLPVGTVFQVTTEQPLESATAKVGQTFDTNVSEDISVNGYTVIPNGSRIRGVVTYVQPATRQQSGVMQVTFNRLTLPQGGSFAIAGKLTSTDSTERRQIDSRADSRVVLVGSRSGSGAVIAGAGNANSPQTSILGALGSILSARTNVAVPVGTTTVAGPLQWPAPGGLRRPFPPAALAPPWPDPPGRRRHGLRTPRPEGLRQGPSPRRRPQQPQLHRLSLRP